MTQRHFLLIYELSDDYLERRGAFRAEHLALAQLNVAEGRLQLGGALAAPADMALFLFLGDDDSAARAFVDADPYVANGLVKKWSVREWTTVVGEGAAQPVSPA